MDNRRFNMTLSLRIWDVDAFVRAAQERALEEGLDTDDVVTTYTRDDLNACIVMLFDPGSGPAGCEITYSESETDELLDEPDEEDE